MPRLIPFPRPNSRIRGPLPPPIRLYAYLVTMNDDGYPLIEQDHPVGGSIVRPRQLASRSRPQREPESAREERIRKHRERIRRKRE